ncbi:MAG TPA: 6-phosphogluconolactonase [Allosphingosinicella sp.]
MDEIEWWEFDSPAELAEQVAGDMAFVIESAVEAHKSARIAVPSGPDAEPVYAALLKQKGIDWSGVTLIPTDDALVGLDDGASANRRLRGWFEAKGAQIVSLIDESALGDYQEAGRLADARLALLQWPLDLVCLTVGENGEVAGICPGPDLDRALTGPRERRAVGVRPDPAPSGKGDRVSLTAAALSSARAVMIVLSGAEKKVMLEKAIEDGPLSRAPIGRLLAELDVPMDIFWSA